MACGTARKMEVPALFQSLKGSGLEEYSGDYTKSLFALTSIDANMAMEDSFLDKN